jgi:hypothetical protein
VLAVRQSGKKRGSAVGTLPRHAHTLRVENARH